MTVEEWGIERSSPEELIHSSHTYQLRNLHYGRCVVHGVRDYGINLVWSDESSRDVFFSVPERVERPIRYGERVAVAIVDGGYLRYAGRDWGINLTWSDTPIYQWQLTGGNIGQAIPYLGNHVGIFNDVEQDHMVYCTRLWGINLRWARDCPRLSGTDNTAMCTVLCRIPLDSTGTRESFGTVTFRGSLVLGSGSPEGETAFVRTIDWTAPPGSAFGQATMSATNLQRGTWRIDVDTRRWLGTCSVELQGGSNAAVNFEQFVAGCGRGAAWPRRVEIGKLYPNRMESMFAVTLDRDLEKSNPQSASADPEVLRPTYSPPPLP